MQGRQQEKEVVRSEPQNAPPLKKFKAGAIMASVWNNQTKDGEGEYKTVSLERVYKDKDGSWKYTTNLRAGDLPKASLVLQKAYEYLAMGEDAEA